MSSIHMWIENLRPKCHDNTSTRLNIGPFILLLEGKLLLIYRRSPKSIWLKQCNMTQSVANLVMIVANILACPAPHQFPPHPYPSALGVKKWGNIIIHRPYRFLHKDFLNLSGNSWINVAVYPCLCNEGNNTHRCGNDAYTHTDQ